MNQIGIHALVWAGGWSEDDARTAISSTKAAGYDFIEVPLLDPPSVDTAMTRALLDEHDLDAGCSLGLSFHSDISSSDPEVVRRGERLLTDAVSVTRDIGATYLGGVIHSAMGKYLEPASERGLRNCVASLRRVGEAARSAGVTLGLEAVNRYESNVVNTAAQALALIDDTGADNIVVHLDTYHMNIEEGDLAGPVLECGERLGYVHIGECNRGYLGSGSIDFSKLFRALNYTGYEGPIAFESFSSAVISEVFCSSLGVWRNLWEDGEHVARHAHAFIEEQLTAAGRSAWARGSPP
ncbi:MAG: sugar phosphate isomerase/epimerase family protein [Actinomycetota bacterium]